MGAFDADREDIITIRDEKNWEPHEQCRARTIVRAGDEEWVLNQQLLFQQRKNGNRKQRRHGGFVRQDSDVDIKSQLGATNRLWVQRMLVDWTFTRGGMPIEISTESMKLLDQRYVDFIYEAIMAAQPVDPDQDEDEDEDNEEGSPFFENVSATTVGAISNHDLEQEQEAKHSRNFLSKS